MNLKDYISKMSDKYGIPSQISFAMAELCSNFEMVKFDYNPLHAWLWDIPNNQPFRKLTDEEILQGFAPHDFQLPSNDAWEEDLEYIGQKSSWGPFLLNGSKAREVGLTGDFCELMTDPRLTTHYFLLYMQQLKQKYFERHGWSGVCSAYEQGRPRKMENGRYVNQTFLEDLRDAGAKSFLTLI